MPTEPGTFEQIALLLGEALQPLAQRLQPDRASGTLGQLGIYLPPELLTPDLRAAIGAGASAAGELPALISALSTSISADAGGITISADAARLAEKAKAIIDAFAAVSRAVNAMGSAPGVTPAELSAFAAALPKRLLDLILVDYLQQSRPTLAGLCEILGVIDEIHLNAGSSDPAKPETVAPTLNFDRISAFLTSPETLARDLYRWGQADFQASLLLSRLGSVMSGLGLPVAQSLTADAVPQTAIEFFIASLTGTPPGVVPPGLDLVLNLDFGDDFSFTFDVAPWLQLAIEASGSATAAARARVQPPSSISFIPPGAGTTIQGEVGVSLARVPAPEESVVTLLGAVGGSRLEAQRLSAGVKGLFAWDPAQGSARGDLAIEGAIAGGKLVISLAEADGFIGSIMGGFGLEAAFDLGFGWTAGQGVYFTGSGGLEVQVPTHVELGPVEIQGVSMRIGVEAASFPTDLGATIKAALGPLSATVEQIGARAILSFPPGGGNLGPANLQVRFKAPTGVGLSLDVGVVKGGGFLTINEERGEYGGALELVFAEVVAVRAIGLITTRNPDGSPGFSLVVLISIDFGTGIQLGFGFTLLAIGGLVGLNRTMNLEALMTGVRTGALGSIMFPQDIVANAPRILSDLRTFFPARQGTFLIGPMLKIGWGTPTLVSLSVGVIIEIPGNIAIVGVLKVAIPDERAPLILLQVSFVGAIEFDKKRLFFFAGLFDSRVLFMTISGEMGLLVAWSDNANFVISVGGFHPRFMPPPLPFPSPARIVVSIIDTEHARIRYQGYFAVTSNTAQLGASAEFFFGFDSFSVQGLIGFDALFQFSPLYFVIDISAAASLRAFGADVFSLQLHLTLEGPQPWRARGTGSISLLFFDISADFDITWGDPSPPALEPIDVLPLVEAEFAKDQSWTALLPPGASLSVTVRSLDTPEDAGVLVLHPVGTLQVRQRAIPLDLSINKVGNRRARDASRVSITVSSASLSRRGDLDESFALAQFIDMDDAAKLSRPAYERQHGGIELTATASAATARLTKRVVRFDRTVIDNRFRRRVLRFQTSIGSLFEHFLGGASIARSPLSTNTKRRLDPYGDAISISGDHFAVASASTNVAVAADAVFASEAAAMDHMASLIAADPNLADAIHVLPSAELSGVTP
ncbi:DUF6603 domain-containing protein [Microvirga massiliensis]|uniref:DUF6603 domain-containing protein n=1 Tax=Microvirga massiliensis TaxID=1033741 RepID=UPI00065F97D9|nr:DUF6603 domain-containing protein [Microvirga massiliensis]